MASSFLSDIKKAASSFLDKAKKKIRDITPIATKTRDSQNWFMNLIKNLGRTIPEPTRGGRAPLKLKEVSIPQIGSLVYYSYDAKYRNYLKYFDEFPLIVCIAYWERGWVGLNLHYIPPQARQELLAALMKIGNQVQSEMEYLKISYALLQQVSKDTMWQATIKKYIANGSNAETLDGRTNFVMSKIIEVNPMDWERVVYLPQEQFVSYTNLGKDRGKNAGGRQGVNKSTVWRDSAKKR